MNKFNQIGAGKNPPSDIYVVVEIPKNSNIKYKSIYYVPNTQTYSYRQNKFTKLSLF